MNIDPRHYLSNRHFQQTKNKQLTNLIIPKCQFSLQLPAQAKCDANFSFSDKQNYSSVTNRKSSLNQLNKRQKKSIKLASRKPLASLNEIEFSLYVPKEKIFQQSRSQQYYSLKRNKQRKGKKSLKATNKNNNISKNKKSLKAVYKSIIINRPNSSQKFKDINTNNDRYSIFHKHNAKFHIQKECREKYPSFQQPQLAFIVAVIYIQRKWRQKTIKNIISSYNSTKNITLKGQSTQFQQKFQQNSNCDLQQQIVKQDVLKREQKMKETQDKIIKLIRAFQSAKLIKNKRKSWKYQLQQQLANICSQNCLKNQLNNVAVMVHSRGNVILNQIKTSKIQKLKRLLNRSLYGRLITNNLTICRMASQIFHQLVQQLIQQTLKQKIKIFYQQYYFPIQTNIFITHNSEQTITNFYNILKCVIHQTFQQSFIQQIINGYDKYTILQMYRTYDYQTQSYSIATAIDLFLKKIQVQYQQKYLKYFDNKFEHLAKSLLKIESKLFFDCYCQQLENHQQSVINYFQIHCPKSRIHISFEYFHKKYVFRMLQLIKADSNAKKQQCQVQFIQQLLNIKHTNQQMLIIRLEICQQLEHTIIYQCCKELEMQFTHQLLIL